MKGHPHHKGAGLEYFHKDHWEKKPGDTMVADGKYCSEMGAPEELKGQVDKLASYAKKHKMKY